MGMLTIEVASQSEDKMVRMEFECAETGAMFDAAYSHSDLCSICKIFAEPQELMDAISDLPNITIDESKETVIAKFIARGQKREYFADLKMDRRVYDSDKKDAIELRAENSILRRRLAKVEDHVNMLGMIAILNNDSYYIKFDELVKMVKSPLQTLEKVANQCGLINSIRGDKDRIEWFKSLNPDLRKFRPMSSDKSALASAILEYDYCDSKNGIEFIRFLISIHIDVNHVYKENRCGEIRCNKCRTHEEYKSSNIYYHACTPLDSIRSCIKRYKKENFEPEDKSCNGSDHESRIKHLAELHEIEHILIEAGAKPWVSE